MRVLSVPPSAIPEVKRACRSLNVEQCEAVAKRALTMENARDIKRYLKQELKRCAPELGAE